MQTDVQSAVLARGHFFSRAFRSATAAFRPSARSVPLMKRAADSDEPKQPAAMPSAAEAVLLVKRLSQNATLPTRATAASAGYDLYSAVEMVVPAKGKAVVPTDLAIAVPEGCYGRVAPRSGLAVKHFLDCGAGVIDADYRGNVGVVLFNFSDTDFVVKPKERIAQLVLERIMTPAVKEVEDLDDTARGSGGFGSTGAN